MKKPRYTVFGKYTQQQFADIVRANPGLHDLSNTTMVSESGQRTQRLIVETTLDSDQLAVIFPNCEIVTGTGSWGLGY